MKLGNFIFNKLLGSVIVFFGFLFFVSIPVLAVNYGEGKYGAGLYSVTSSPTPAPTATNAPSSGQSSSSSSNTVSSSTETPGCGKSVSAGIPDLFEIRVNGNSATLYFSPPSQPYSSFYVAYSNKINSWDYGVEFNQEYSGGVLKYKINLLKPNSLYYFKMRAGNGCAAGAWGNIMSAKTTSSYAQNKTFYKNLKTAITSTVSKIFSKPQKTTVAETQYTIQTPEPTVRPFPTTQPAISLLPTSAPKVQRCVWIFCF